MTAKRTTENDLYARNGSVAHEEESKRGIHCDEMASESQQEDIRLKEFLQERHGRIDLNPLPSISLDDPLNWPKWKKNSYLFLLAFHAFFALFMFAGLIPGYEKFAEDYHTSLTGASYLTSVQILFAGVGPLFWGPLSSRYGRRPIFLVSTLGSCICNIGGARAYTYGAQIVCRSLVGIFISPPLAIGTAVVAETFFAHERGSKIGVWTLFLTMSTSIGPFLMGFLFQRQSVYWVFWLFAVVNFCQFLAYFFLNAESLYIRSTDRTTVNITTKKQKMWSIHRIDPTPLTFRDFVRPFAASRYLSITAPACAYAVVFGYAGVAITIEIPQVMGRKFNLSAQGTGLQFVAIFIGNVLGEQVSTWTSDRFVRYMNKRRYDQAASAAATATNGHANGISNGLRGDEYPITHTQTIGGTSNIDPTPRLYLSYLGFLTSVVGLVVWGVESQRAPAGSWTVRPLIGAAIASFGLQVVTTTLVTFAIDCHRDLSAEIGVLINVIRQTWSFIGPFYFPPMFDKLGFGLSGGVLAIICGGFWALIVGVHFWERRKFIKKGVIQT